MESHASIEMKSIDFESMITLSAVNTQDPYVSVNEVVDHDLTHLLATNKDANDIITATDTTTNIYTNQASNRTYYSKEIESNLRETFDLFTTQGLNDGTFAISTQFDETAVTPDATIYDIGVNSITQNKTIAIQEPSNSLYDSHIKIEISDNLGEFYTENNDFGVIFQNSANNNFIRAINSEFSTTDGSKQMTVQEYADFNFNHTAGNNLTKYYKIDNTQGGKPTAHSIPVINRLDLNGYNIEVTNLSNFTLENVGAYRVQQFPDTIDIFSYANNDIENSVSVQDIPFYNSTISNTDYETSRLPADSLFIDTFNTIFNLSENVIVPGWKIKMDVTDTENSGYSVGENMIARSEATGIFSLDDTKLVDNFMYMKDFVQGTHKIDFNDASLTIETHTNGEELNITNTFSLSTERETLEQSQIVNGEIKLNIRDYQSRVNVINNTNILSEQLDVQVHYNNESQMDGISPELKTHSYVKYVSQLVAKNPMYDIGYAHDKNASLNIYNNNQIINELYNPTHIQLDSRTEVPKGTLEVFKINTQQQLTSIGGFRDTNTDVEEIYMEANILLSNLNNIAGSEGVLSSAKVDCKLKQLSSLSLKTSANEKGWVVTSITNDILSTSSKTAYTYDTNIWPSLNEITSLLQENSNNIYYNISISTLGANINPNLLTDKVVINWGSSPTELTSKTEIYQSKFRIIKDVTPTVTEIIVPTSEYNVTNTFIPLVPQAHTLFKCTSRRYFKYAFDLSLRQYEGITLETPELYSITTYYRIQNNNTGENLQHNALKNITSKAGQPYINYLEHTEVFYTVDPLESLSFEGVLTKQDFEDISVKINSYDDITNNVIPLTNTYTMSSQYGIPITMELLQSFEKTNLTGDIIMSLQSTLTNVKTGDEGDAILKSHNGYTIQLKTNYQLDTNYNNTYSVEYFSSSFGNLGNGDKTDISMNTNKYLTVANGYSNITYWDNTMYNIDVTYEADDSSTTVLNIVKISTGEVAFKIRTPEFRFLNTQVFVTRGNADCYRRIKTIGTDVDHCTTTEIFYPVDYTFTNPIVSADNIVSIDIGVYAVRDSLNYETIKTIGSLLEFELLQDKISVNMIGSASNTLEPINWVSGSNTGLTTRYNSDDNTKMSRQLSIDRYRGFYGQSNVDQVYTIERKQSVATFSVYNSQTERTASQSFDVSNGAVFTVNNLVDNNGNTVGEGNIGLKLHFNYSMLDTTENKNFVIYTKGDNVQISIVNPRVEQFEPVTINKTLKNYLMYEYDGVNFDNTNGPLKYNSSRLKLNNNDIDVDKVTYSMNVVSKLTKVYHIANYLGNPADNGDANAYVEPLNWGQSIGTADYDEMISNGITINALKLTKTPGFNSKVSNSYFVQLPPYHQFEMRANIENDVIPYNPSVNVSTNKVVRYLPVNSENVYYPFRTQSYTYIDGSVHSVSFVANQVNDVTITHYNDKYLHEYIENPNTNPRHFKVEGNNFDIKLFAGLKGTTGTEITRLFIGPGNRLLNLNNSSETFWLQAASPSNEGALLNLRQPIGPYNISANRIFATNNATIKPNISLFVESFFITNSSINKFDLKSGTGQKVTLYTRKVSLDEDTGNYKMNVYRYSPLSSINNDGVNGVNLDQQVDTILYNSRHVKTLNIPNLSIQQTSLPVWNNLLNSITIQNVRDATWVLDTSFNQVVSLTLANLNRDAMTKVPPLIFSSTSSDQIKVTLVTKRSIMKFLNKLGMPIMEIDSNGNVKTQILSTNAVALNNVYSDPQDSSFTHYSLMSTASYGTGY